MPRGWTPLERAEKLLWDEAQGIGNATNSFTLGIPNAVISALTASGKKVSGEPRSWLDIYRGDLGLATRGMDPLSKTLTGGIGAAAGAIGNVPGKLLAAGAEKLAPAALAKAAAILSGAGRTEDVSGNLVAAPGVGNFVKRAATTLGENAASGGAYGAEGAAVSGENPLQGAGSGAGIGTLLGVPGAAMSGARRVAGYLGDKFMQSGYGIGMKELAKSAARYPSQMLNDTVLSNLKAGWERAKANGLLQPHLKDTVLAIDDAAATEAQTAQAAAKALDANGVAFPSVFNLRGGAQMRVMPRTADFANSGTGTQKLLNKQAVKDEMSAIRDSGDEPANYQDALDLRQKLNKLVYGDNSRIVNETAAKNIAGDIGGLFRNKIEANAGTALEPAFAESAAGADARYGQLAELNRVIKEQMNKGDPNEVNLLQRALSGAGPVVGATLLAAGGVGAGELGDTDTSRTLGRLGGLFSLGLMTKAGQRSMGRALYGSARALEGAQPATQMLQQMTLAGPKIISNAVEPPPTQGQSSVVAPDSELETLNALGGLSGPLNDPGVAQSDPELDMLNSLVDDSKKKAMSASERLIDAMIQAESAGKAGAVSPKGAQGLMQIMPATFKEWSGKLGIKDADPMNPEHNKQVGTAYLNSLLDRYKQNEPLALAAYNWGLGHVDALHKALGDSVDAETLSPMLPKETQNYIARILDTTNEG